MCGQFFESGYDRKHTHTHTDADKHLPTIKAITAKPNGGQRFNGQFKNQDLNTVGVFH